MITAKVIADSTNSRGNRLTTFYVKFPRIIEAEILRHRMLSFTASSRAINLEKHIKSGISFNTPQEATEAALLYTITKLL